MIVKKKLLIFVIIILLASSIQNVKGISSKIKAYSSNYNNIYNFKTSAIDNIVFVGDSLTKQFPLDIYFENMFVINNGKEEMTIEDLSNNLKELIYQYNPSSIILNIGLNDMKNGKTNNEIITGIQAIVNQIKKNRPNAKIYVESIQSVNSSINNVNNEKIKSINNSLQKEYKDYYIDINSYLDETMYTNNGINITEEGYATISAIIKMHLLHLKDNNNNIYNIKVKPSENIVFLGDSITHFYPLDYFYKNLPVVNSGKEGSKTIDVLNNLDSLVYQYNPSKVFLLIGINDIKNGLFSKNDVINNIQKIIDNIRKERPNAEIFIESIYPINTSQDKKINREAVETRSREEIILINRELKKLCNHNNITFIDIYHLLLDEEDLLKLDYTRDGVHLTNKAYVKVTSELLKYITK